MYCEFYQLTERPFNVTPDPKFLYLNARYREAIASLNYGITQRKGFITLIGEAGTGKTTLLNKLLEELDPKTKSVFIFNTNVTFEEILEYIFAEFDLPVHSGKKLYMLQRLNAFLLEELRSGGNVALLIDEAQDLQFSVLEDLRLLSNLETAKEKILQIVLSGQPELGQKLSNPVLRQLRQRIGINCRLLPLSRDEITEYVQFRLQAAGCPDLKLFTREAEDQVYHFSRGIPRLVNVVCDNALVIGYALGKKRIGADIVTEAAADLLSVESVAEERTEAAPAEIASPQPLGASTMRRRSRLGLTAAIGAVALAGVIAAGRVVLQSSSDEPVSEPAKVAAAPPQHLEVIRPGSQPRGSGIDLQAPRVNERVPVAEPPAPDSAGVEARPVRDDQSATPEPLQPNPEVPSTDIGAPNLRAVTAEPAGPARPVDPVGGIVAVERRMAEERLPSAGMREDVARENVVPTPAERPQAQPNAAPQAAFAPANDEGSAERSAVVRRDEPVARPHAAVAAAPARAIEERPASEEPADLADESPETADVPRSPRLDGMQFAQIVVRGGDSISGIALRKYGQAGYTVLDLLKLANPDVRDINVINVGQTIRLPELGEGFPILNDKSSGRYELLVFSTPQLSRANGLQGALRGRGFNARVSDGSSGFRQPIYRVVVSGTNRDEIAAVGGKLQKLFREDTRIAQLGE